MASARWLDAAPLVGGGMLWALDADAVASAPPPPSAADGAGHHWRIEDVTWDPVAMVAGFGGAAPAVTTGTTTAPAPRPRGARAAAAVACQVAGCTTPCGEMREYNNRCKCVRRWRASGNRTPAGTLARSTP